MPAAPPSKKKIIKSHGEVLSHLSIVQPIQAPISKPANNSVATLEKVLIKVWLVLFSVFCFSSLLRAFSILLVKSSFFFLQCSY